MLANRLIVYIVSCLIFLFVVSGAYAQSTPQIYVHTDRDIYFPGDRVWYKAYVVRDGKLDPTVRNLYLDWADEKGNIIKSDVSMIAEGMSPNSFYIPVDYSSPYLQFNAYLGRMEQHKEYGYYRTLAVVQRGSRGATLRSSLHNG